MADQTNLTAPHGYGADGKPLAPYGWTKDGRPKLDGRGGDTTRSTGRPRVAGIRSGRSSRTARAPKPRREAGMPKPAVKSAGDRARRANLVSIISQAVTPLVAIAVHPWIRGHIGERQSMALAGDAVILRGHAEAVADAAIVASQDHPRLLAWLDRVDDAGPYLAFLTVGASIVKGLAANHANPDPRLANAGILMVQVDAMRMVDEIERAATEMGISVDVVPEDDGEDVAA